MIRVLRDIFDDNRSKFFSNDFENSLLNIMLCSKNDKFKLFYTAVYHNDSDCSKCRSFRILFRRSSLREMMKIESVRLMNSLRLFVVKMYERCRVFSLIVINLIDKHFSEFSWFYTIQFICDSGFSTIVLFLCFW